MTLQNSRHGSHTYSGNKGLFSQLFHSGTPRFDSSLHLQCQSSERSSMCLAYKGSECNVRMVYVRGCTQELLKLS
jgi:hypothetical protein